MIKQLYLDYFIVQGIGGMIQCYISQWDKRWELRNIFLKFYYVHGFAVM